ncbi:ABC transporter [Ophiocordyceps camponoti-floridani]|uniref:ABC transporter n=1 Tax=Ophiocordyceps camponoti-floridani TaxID=2030778 RepID=A0A8H4QDR8_9HYPO|nr:ABC transporter [Ophiocordyceps camponoti-floridani]
MIAKQPARCLLLRQIWTLMQKDLRCLIRRHGILTVCVAFIMPILLAGFFTFAKNLFLPPAQFGIGTARPIMTLREAAETARKSGHDRLILVDGPTNQGDQYNMSRVLDVIEDETRSYGSLLQTIRISQETELTSHCRSSLRGVTRCLGAVVMRGAPSFGHWNYTIRTDAFVASGPQTVQVGRNKNLEQVFVLPLQRAVDSAIAIIEGHGPLTTANEWPFTSKTQAEHGEIARMRYLNNIVSFMGVAFVTTIVGVTYHLAGAVATDRESGMARLMDAMMPGGRPGAAQATRIVAHHLAYTMLYAPAWIVAAFIIRYGIFIHTSIVIIVVLQLLGGLALVSMAILSASFFNRAQLSSSCATLATLILAILAQSLTSPRTTTVSVLSALFAPCNYVYFVTLVARFERTNRPTSLMDEAPGNSPWSVPGLALWLLLGMQIICYPLLAAWVERWRFGTPADGRRYGRPKPEADEDETAVRLDGLTKVYYPALLPRLASYLRCGRASEPVVAVNGLSLSCRRGQIVTLLGANGSGKSTTLDAIAGLHQPTGGSIVVDGGLGIAPQKNVLWDDVTVLDHLETFGRLKSPAQPPTAEETADLVRAIDLWPKRDALAKTLSGGQKRKLQLGMMLAGGSSVCCVDEVSSGLDPISRRKIWDILLAERGRRTLILTTHFLDEADLLADHMAVLSRGALRAAGSSVELKERFGGGYHVRVPAGSGSGPEVDGVGRKEAPDGTTYAAPTSDLAARVIRKLDAAGIGDYHFSSPTIEDVFLRLAEEVAMDETKTTTTTTTEKALAASPLQLMDGTPIGNGRQMTVLLRKRATVFKRNWLLYLVAFLLPIAAAAMTSMYARGRGAPVCGPPDGRTVQDALGQMRSTDYSPVLAIGPASRLNDSDLAQVLMPLLTEARQRHGSEAGETDVSRNQLLWADTYDDFGSLVEGRWRNLTAGVWLGAAADDETRPTVAWLANKAVTVPLMAQQLLDSLQNRPPTTVLASWLPFDVPFDPGVGSVLNLVVYMGLALVFFPAFFGLYPSGERVGGVRALQYSNGVRPLPLWAAYVAFDMSVVLPAAALATALWAALAAGSWYHVGYVFVVLALYGLASTELAYLVSLWAPSQLASFAWTASLQAVLFLVYLVAYVCVLTYVSVDRVDGTLLVAHFVLAAVAPICSVVRSLFVVTNLFSTACDGRQPSTNPGGLLLYGGPMLYLAIQSIVFFGLLLWFDSSGPGLLSSCHPRRARRGSTASDVDHDEAVAAVASPPAGLSVRNLSKSFGRNTAVDDVSFDVKRGEVFALLGPNGAGKSTTMALIRGDERPSRGRGGGGGGGGGGGDVMIGPLSVTRRRAAARARLGVCPQADALDSSMTVREHLDFYARVRGVPDARHNVEEVIRAVGLQSLSRRMATALSGGNKRKLSLAIALMGNPAVILLDEPSSGLDAAAKRVLWPVLASTAVGRSILLTTHSMEEADALAARAGILARRMLAVGSLDELRRRAGHRLHVHLVASSAPRTTREEMAAMTEWVRIAMPDAEMEAATYHGQLRFAVRAQDVSSASENLARHHQLQSRPQKQQPSVTTAEPDESSKPLTPREEKHVVPDSDLDSDSSDAATTTTTTTTTTDFLLPQCQPGDRAL